MTRNNIEFLMMGSGLQGSDGPSQDEAARIKAGESRA